MYKIGTSVHFKIVCSNFKTLRNLNDKGQIKVSNIKKKSIMAIGELVN